MDTDVDRLMRDIGTEMGMGHTYNRAPLGVYFGSPGVEADDPYFGGQCPRRTGQDDEQVENARHDDDAERR